MAGSPDRLSESGLHETAWTLLQPSFQQTRQDALAHFWRLLGQGKASANVEYIVAAAFQGRVETLFTAVAGQQWGCFNQSTGEVILHEYNTPHSRELLNLAAMNTLSNGGTVYALLPGDLPEGIKLAAIFRY